MSVRSAPSISHRACQLYFIIIRRCSTHRATITVFKNRRCAHPGALFPHRPAWPRPVRPHARHALRSTIARAARPHAQRKPRLAGRRGRAGIQVGPQCAAGWVRGVVCRAARREASRGPAPFCVGRRGAAAVRRYVVRFAHLVRPFRDFRSPRRAVLHLFFFFWSTQLPTPQIYLDDAGIYPALFEQPCACGAASPRTFCFR
jgi:hypothetical protein